MKKSLFTLLLTIATVLACIFGFSACGESLSGISFNTFTVDGTNVYGEVSNDTAEFSFLDEITVTGKAKFVVSLDKNGMQTVVTKTVTLHEGDNFVYVFEMVDDEVCNTYTVTVRRRPMHSVTFDPNGGTAIEKQVIEEDHLATEPESPTKAGCTFTGWDYDFTQPITQNTKITAQFAANKEMSNFDFTSTVTTCSITGVKDKTVTEIVVPDYVTAIANGAFSGCSSLESITLPFVGATKDGTENTHLGYIFGASDGSYNGDYVPASLKKITITSATSISSGAFAYCNGLTDITVSENNTVYRSIEGNLYSKDGTTLIQYAVGKTATAVTVPDSVTSIGARAFEGCDSLKSVEIPDSVTNIGEGAFHHCSNLTEITIPFVGASNSATDHQAIFGYIFGYATNFIPPTMVGVITRPEAIIGAAYQYWNDGTYYHYYIPASLKSVTVAGENLPDYAFKNCNKLTSITVLGSVTNIGDYAFDGCSGLTSVTLGNSVTSIGERAFYDCSGLTSVTIPDSVTNIDEWAFEKCTSLKSVLIGNSVASIGNHAFYDCDNLISVYITDIAAWCNILFHNFDANPLSVANNLYLKNELVTELTIPDSVTSIGDRAFYNCDSLTGVTIPDSVTNIGWDAFWGCDNLTSVTLGNSVASIGEYAFSDCTGLKSITIPDSVTNIGYKAFYNTAYYKNEANWEDGLLYLGKYLIQARTSISGAYTVKDGTLLIASFAFADCTNLTRITIPDSVRSIGDKAFASCDNLTSVTLGNSVTSIGDSAFSGCDSLTSVTIPDSVTSIGAGAFADCTNLTSITIPDSVTSIGEYAFTFCTSLTSVTIPDSVTSIGDYAFDGCDSLTSVYYKGTAEEWANISINSNSLLTNATVYYYSETQPTASGNYWYYDENGNPAIW